MANKIKPIRFIQHNCSNSGLVMDELRKITEEEEIDILCLQEPYTINSTVPGFPVTCRQITNGPNPMVAIIVLNNEYVITKLIQFCDQHQISIEIKYGSLQFVLVSQYFQYREEIEIHIEKLVNISRFCNNNGTKMLFTGDVNAKSTMWHSPYTDAKGEKVEDAIAELNLHIINEDLGIPTFHHPTGGTSYIDITMTTTTMVREITKWNVLENKTTSFHNVIRFEYNTRDVVTETQRNWIYNLKNADWNMANNILLTSEITNTVQSENINAAAKTLTKAIQNAINIAVPKTKIRKKITTAWWSNALTAKRREVENARKRYLKEQDVIRKEVYKRHYRYLRREYYHKIKLAKANSWKLFVENNMADPWNFVYKIARAKVHPPAINSNLKREDGTFTKGWSDSTRYLLNSLLPDDGEEDDTPEQRNIRQQMPISENNSRIVPATEDEVSWAILRISPYKAPGVDGIKGIMLRNVTANIVQPLTSIINRSMEQCRFPNIWKQAEVIIISKGKGKDPSMTKSYRPICLISTLGKTFERIICDRLQDCLKETLHPNQYGFTKGRSTEDALNKIRTSVTNCPQKYVLAIMVDISGAFDNLWWPALWTRLSELKVPNQLICLLKDYCENRWASVSTPTEKIQKPLSKGCPQGSILGPVLWNIIMDGALKMLEGNCVQAIAYADDLTILIAAQVRSDLERQAKVIMNNLEIWCNQNKLNLSLNKTQCILLKGSLQRNPTVRFKNRPITTVKEAKLLGVNISSKLLCSEHIKQCADMAKKAINMLMTYTKRNFNLPDHTLRQYYTSIFVGIVAYCSSFWIPDLKKTNTETLLRAQRQCLIQLYKPYRTVRREALLLAVGIPPIDLEIKRRTYNYWRRKGNLMKANSILPETRGNPKRRVMELWNERLQSEGHVTKEIFETVHKRIQCKFNPTKEVIQVLTGHGPFRAKLHQFGRTNQPNCDCSPTPQTVKHIILQCTQAPEDLINFRNLNSITTLRDLGNALRKEQEATKFQRICKQIINQLLQQNFQNE